MSAPAETGPGTVIYACSGCSDAGELADRTARRLSAAGLGKMSCLAGIGGRVKPLLRVAREAGRILVIDGCPLNCARHTLVSAGIEHFQHLSLDRFGLRKGSVPVTPENLATAVHAAESLLRAPAATAVGAELGEGGQHAPVEVAR